MSCMNTWRVRKLVGSRLSLSEGLRINSPLGASCNFPDAKSRLLIDAQQQVNTAEKVLLKGKTEMLYRRLKYTRLKTWQKKAGVLQRLSVQ